MQSDNDEAAATLQVWRCSEAAKRARTLLPERDVNGTTIGGPSLGTA